MAVASKSNSVHKSRASVRAKTVAEPTSISSKSSKRRQTSPPLLFNPKSAPAWLLRLCYLQHRSTAIAFLLVTAMLGTYSWVVFSQKLWTEAYRRLETLQIYERQLTTTNETLKNQAVRQSQQPSMGLVPPNPAETIVLPPAPPHTLSTATSPHLLPPQTGIDNSIPLGY